MIAFIWQSDWEFLAVALTQRLLDAGYEVTVFSRGGQGSAKRAKDSESKISVPARARQAPSLAAAVEEAQTVLTLLGTPQEVEDVYLGKGGVFEKAPSASQFIDLSTSSPRLAKELYALAAVHEHRFVEAPLDGGVIVTGSQSSAGASANPATANPATANPATANPATANPATASVPDPADGLRILAAAEPDTLAAALPVLQALTPQVIDAGLPGSGTTLRLVSLIALAGALMGLTEALAFALAADGGAQPEGGTDRILETLRHSAAASTVLDVFGARILEEEFASWTPGGPPTRASASSGYDLHLFFNDLTCALDAAEEFNLVLPGLETAHQLYDLLVLAGGGQKGIHALVLIYCDRAQCARHDLNWELAQRAMDVYERVDEDSEYDYDDDYDFEDDEDCDDLDCGHSHPHLHPHQHDSDGRPFIGGFFSPN